MFFSQFNWDGEGFVMEYVHNINRWYELFKTADEDDK